METTQEQPENTPIKAPERLQLEYKLIGFSNRDAEKLIEAIQKTVDKCREFSKKVLATYNRFLMSSERRLDDLPPHEEYLQHLHTRFQGDKLNIQSIKKLDERVLENVIAQAIVTNYLLEDQFQLLPARMADIKAHSSKHEVTVRFLEPAEFEIISSDAKAWKKFIANLNGPI